ncbi:LTA synthase family protein [Mesorhizobium sp. CN2-181]|uniref:LTA synthase family protein n=1 Tax=Mesorhizobium yinganensis TaxID=3157707 RepID=UPI0032B7C001
MAPFGHPLALVAASFAVAFAVAVMVDGFAMPAKVRAANRPRPPASLLVDLLARAAVVAVVFALFFAISWRPLYAAAGTISTLAIFTLISRAKYEFIREPLVFSDIALVMLVFRHKEMFYAGWLNILFWLVAFGYVFGASALFMIFEPSVLPAANRPVLIALMAVAAILPWLLPLERHARRTLAAISAKLTGNHDIKVLTVRLGTLAAVTYSFLTWLGMRPNTLQAPAETGIGAPAVASRHTAPPLVVIWQSESFMDMRHFGVSSLALPNLDRLRRRAAEWGRMSSIFEGGYTLRTEFSVISGLPPDQLGPDASHPYLRAGPYADIAWPNRFRKAGWSTHFIHPYDRQFFSRDRALPQLGFEALTMLDAFDHDREHEGPYVSDLTLSRRVLDRCREDGGKGQFLFAASMENHGPWHPGRHGDANDPLDIYLAILQRSDAALGHLADELDRMDRPVWLAFYGDHAPMLKSFADPFPDPRTDYLIVPMGHAAGGVAAAGAPAEKAPWRIIADMVRHAGFGNWLASGGPATDIAR